MTVPLKEAFDVFQDIRGMIIFYLFIMEESIQSAGMAAYMLRKQGNITESKIVAVWCDTNLITDAMAFNQSIGVAAWPMNEAFRCFFDAARKNMQAYLVDPPEGE